MRRHTAIVLSLGLGLVAACGSTTADTPVRPPTASATPDAFCAEAVDQVKAYKAPGQPYTVLEMVTLGMAAERRPKRIGGWAPAERLRNDCQVMFGAVIGNEPQWYLWWYTPQTGHVATTDAKTKQLSGW